MPVISDWPDFFSNSGLESWQSLNCSRTLQSRFQREVSTMYEFAVAQNLVKPRFVYSSIRVAEWGKDWVRFENGAEFTEASVLIEKFAGASELVVAVGTIGEDLENAVSEFFKDKKAIKALALEEVAVAAIFEFTNAVLIHVDKLATDQKLQASSPIYPGQGDFSLEQQRQVFQLAGGEQIGMRMMDTEMMFPAKSFSMVFGLGQEMPRWDRKKDCEMCKARDRCRFRTPEGLAA